MDASIIIPVYKRTEWIKSCLNRVLVQESHKSFEIIIIDDGSPNCHDFELIVSGIKQRENCLLQYHKKEHAGPAAARNYGVQVSSGAILCFLDDDSMPHEGWLEEITRPINESCLVGIVNGKTLSLEQGKGVSRMLEEYVYPEKCWASCNIAYRREAFESVGGFDEYFKEPSWEDNDLGLRVLSKGYEHVYNEKAIVSHPHENTLSEYREKCQLNGRGAAAFSRKYLFKKPYWAIAVPVLMSRRLIYGFFPSVWLRQVHSAYYLKYLWSFFSIQGFLKEIFKAKSE